MRKILTHLLFIFLLIIIAYFAVSPFIFKQHYMRDYCDSLKERKLSSSELKIDITKNNLNFIEDIKNNNILIYDDDTIGKYTCRVDYSFIPAKIIYNID